MSRRPKGAFGTRSVKSRHLRLDGNLISETDWETYLGEEWVER